MNRLVHQVSTRFVCLVLASTFLFASEVAIAQQPKSPDWSHAFDLSCRKFGELEFTKDTKKFGVEVFKDPNNQLGVYICQTGDIGVTGNFDNIKVPISKSKAPVWTAGLDLKARKAGEMEFTDKTKTYAMEVFFDENANNWIYITENGQIAVAPGKEMGSKDLKSPKWLHSVDLKVRKGGEKDWKNAKAYGIEVYQDMNNGNLIFLSETGAIAVIPSRAYGKGENKTPDWLHGQDLKCRKFKEADFTKKTQIYGVEIFRDNFTNTLVLITDTGNIAVVPADSETKAPTSDPKDADLTHGLDLSVRQAGEKDFSPDTRTFGIEVFDEPNVGVTIYLCETGAIAAVGKKK